MNNSHTELAGQIATLDDVRAIAALQLVLQRQGQPVDQIEIRDSQAHLEEALRQPGILQLAEPDLAATPGTLARMALAHLAARDQADADIVQRAITRQVTPGQRIDPLSLAVGALVLAGLLVVVWRRQSGPAAP